MNESIYKKYCEQKLPHDFQKRAEGFASMSDTVQEEMFRAGFYCGLHINDVFPDPDRPVLDNGYILARAVPCYTMGSCDDCELFRK